jgi:hypothetical protein
MATPPNRSPKPTVKEERAQRRAAQLEAYKKKQATDRRNRILGIVGGSLALVLVVGGVAAALYFGTQDQPGGNPQSGETPIPVQTVDPELLEGSYEDRLQLFPGLDATHTSDPVTYEQTPPAGGPHDQAWLNCGVYDEQQHNENAVHALEHGAIWITYDPDFIAPGQVDALIALAPTTYTVISPYQGLGKAMAVSAWGAQLRFTDVDDPAVTEFIEQFWRSADAPEPNAPCTGALDGPGKVS